MFCCARGDMQAKLPDPKDVDAFTKAFETLIKYYGPYGTLAIIVIIALAFTSWRLYQQWQERRKTDKTLAEKDQTIQRLAQQERSHRRIIFKLLTDWSNEEIERIIDSNDFKNVTEARNMLEQRDVAGSTEATRREPEPTNPPEGTPHTKPRKKRHRA